MDDPKWLRLITIGLVLAAIAVGYFLFTGRLSSNKISKTKSSPTPSTLGQNVKVTPSPTPVSAYTTVANRTQGQTQTLPSTGFPLGLAVVFSVSALVSGWSLRKFPE